MSEHQGRGELAAGCGAALLSLAVGCLLLAANGALLVAGYQFARGAGIPLPAGPIGAQLIYFLGPLLMLGLQWWLIDLVTTRTRQRRRRFAAPPEL